MTTVVINQEIGLCPWQIVKETSGSSYYYVEFPEEEGKHDYNTGGRSRIDEGKLASSFSQVLNLKRKREEENTLLLEFWNTAQEEDVGTYKKQKRGIMEKKGVEKAGKSKMAEEAGLNMPHPQP